LLEAEGRLAGERDPGDDSERTERDARGVEERVARREIAHAAVGEHQAQAADQAGEAAVARAAAVGAGRNRAGDALARDRSDHAQREAAGSQRLVQGVEAEAGFDGHFALLVRYDAVERVEVDQHALGAGCVAPRMRAADDLDRETSSGRIEENGVPLTRAPSPPA